MLLTQNSTQSSVRSSLHPQVAANIVGDGGGRRVVALNTLLQLIANGLRPDYTPERGRREGGREKDREERREGGRDPLLL